MNIQDMLSQYALCAMPQFRNPPYRASDAVEPAVPQEVLFARDFVNEQQVLGRPIACHGDNCGFLSPDALPGQEFAVGAAYDLLYGYFLRAAQNLRMPSPLDPDDDDDDEDDENEFDDKPLRQ